MRHPSLGPGLMVLAMLCFATKDTASKFVAEDYAITQIVWVRYLFFLGFAVIVSRKNGVIATLRTTRPWLQAGRAVLGVAFLGSMAHLAMIRALEYSPAGSL